MRVLLAEDETRIVERLSAALQRAGFAVDCATDGIDALHLGTSEPYDAIVLDIGLPQLDGVSILERWRAANIKTPVLILTARARWHEKLAGFNAGADDYLTKPFEYDEVVVRLKALIRRSAGHASPVLDCGPLRLDANAARLECDGELVPLTAHEYRIGIGSCWMELDRAYARGRYGSRACRTRCRSGRCRDLQRHGRYQWSRVAHGRADRASAHARATSDVRGNG